MHNAVPSQLPFRDLRPQPAQRRSGAEKKAICAVIGPKNQESVSFPRETGGWLNHSPPVWRGKHEAPKPEQAKLLHGV